MRDLAVRSIAAAAASAGKSAIEPGELQPLLELGDDQLRELRLDRKTLARALTRSKG